MSKTQAEIDQQLLAKINLLKDKTAKIPDSDLPRRTASLRERAQHGESLDSLLPEAFALVREVAKRKLNQSHFDVQLLGGIALHQGKVAEIKTGEGKTLVATLPVYLNALLGKGVHVVTVNEYLARRDAEWMGPIYAALGLTVSSIVPENSYRYTPGPIQSPFPVAVSKSLRTCSRREAYQADITYGLASEFGFDYLRDNLVTEQVAEVQRREEEGGHSFALIDEVDSILIDEARTPLIIAQETVEDTSLFTKLREAVSHLKENADFEVDPDLKIVYLTEEGQHHLEELLAVKNLYDPENQSLVFHAEAALKARALMARDKDYVVKDGEVVIVDEFTGRLMHGRRFTEGLHQALEAKEGLRIRSENKTLATVSIQSYFRRYKKLAGMSGTALPGKKEFEQVYGMTVVDIPTNKSVVRLDHKDRIYLSQQGKERALVQELTNRKLTGQPVLVGTRSIAANEHLSEVLSAAKIKHQVLNAKNHELEAKIIAQAGQSGAVTVATNLAGRGVDILLGGNPPHPSDSVLVKAAGGLVVIGTERHESKRIDEQLRGRSGRQGDPGESAFFLSLDDELPKTFDPEGVEEIKTKYTGSPPNLEVSKKAEVLELFDQVQQKVERRNEEVRIQLLKYDDFVDRQREAMDQMRRKFLISSNLTKTLHRDIFNWLTGISTIVKRYQVSAGETIIDFTKALRVLRPLFIAVSDDVWVEKFHTIKTIRAFGIEVQNLVLSLEQKMKEREGEEILVARQRKAYLSAIDELFMEHLTELETIRAGIDFVSLSGQEPLDEFKKEADEKFRTLLARVPEKAVENYLKSLV